MMVSINPQSRKKSSPRITSTPLIIVTVLLAPAFFFFHQSQNGASSEQQLDIDSLNSFALNLFSKLASQEKNVVVSPASIATALSMVQSGTTLQSKAQTELVSTLGKQPATTLVRKSKQDKGVEFVMASSAWLKHSVLPQYSKTVREKYEAQASPLPSSSADPINRWVDKATSGRIPSILDGINQNTLAILINAVYFKGSWTIPFDPEHTQPGEPFYGPKGSQHGVGEVVTKVNMMSIRKSKFPYAEYQLDGNTIQVVKIPYGKEKHFNAVVMVPKGEGTIDDIIDNMTPDLWRSWIAGLVNDDIGLSLPRFGLEYGVKSLKSVLRRMGVNAVFDSRYDNPQLLGMTVEKDAYLDDILHKATIECNEEGTVATGATSAVVMARSLDLFPTVYLNRPFLFSIVQDDQILFLARIDDPKQASL